MKTGAENVVQGYIDEKNKKDTFFQDFLATIKSIT